MLTALSKIMISVSNLIIYLSSVRQRVSLASTDWLHQPKTKITALAFESWLNWKLCILCVLLNRQLLVQHSIGARNYRYEQERKLGKFFLLCL